MPFDKINIKKTGLYIVEQVISAIKKGEYKVGDKLPSERKIAEEMGVSRPSVREALSALQIVGILESRHGDGTYIKKSGQDANLETQALSILKEDEDPYTIWEARETLECGFIKLAVENANSKDINRMHEAMDDMIKSVESGEYKGYFNSDQNFHLAIAEATHNPYLDKITRSLVKVMQQRLWQEMKKRYYIGGEGNMEKSLKTHQEILNAIKDKKKELAEKWMIKHFKELGWYLR